MSKYNMDILAKCNELDASNTVKGFRSSQDYFDMLTNFTVIPYNNLRLYNPILVVHREDIRKDFLKELNAIKNTVSLLKITPIMTQINNIEEAVDKQREKQLSDGISTFFATMDILISHIVEARLPDTGTQASAVKSKHLILAVDDKPELLATLTNMLSKEYKVISVTSAEAALKALEKHVPNLFLLDIEMPDINGYDLAGMIRKSKKFENVPILFLTSKNTKGHVMTAMKSGGNDYLLKPVDKQMLIMKIEQHLAKER